MRSFAHFYLAIALVEQHRFDSAVEEDRKALAVSPRDAAAHYNLGSALLSNGKYAEAVHELNVFLELARHDPSRFGEIPSAKQLLAKAQPHLVAGSAHNNR